MKKKILLTGGSGFIGRNIKESYLGQIYDICVPSHAMLDLANRDSVAKFFNNTHFDVVVHSAARAGHRNSKDSSNVFYNNMLMFENLVFHSGKYDKFINLGSGAIYDVSQNITNADESYIYKKIPTDELGLCKYVQQKRIDELENFVNLNIFGIFGKYEDWEIRFISNAVCKSVFNLPITLRQNRRFSYVYIDDLMPILEYFIESVPKFNSYNIVPDEGIELLDIAKIIEEKCGNKNGIEVSKTGFGFDYTGNNERLKSETGVKFEDIELSIERLIKYYESNKSLIDKNLLLYDK